MEPELLVEENHRMQKELSVSAFKRDVRKLALQIASNNKPSYYGSGLNQIGQGLQQQPNYDLIGEAEKIYQWLIKNEVV